MSPKLAGVRLRRMRAQLDAVRVVVRALRATPRCADLDRVAHGWNGVTDPVWRKRLVRHVRDCPHCALYGRGLVSPEKLLVGVVSLPVAVGVATEVPAAGVVSSIWSAIQKFVGKKLVVGATAMTIAAGGGFAYAIYETPVPQDSSPTIAQPSVTDGAASGDVTTAVAPSDAVAPGGRVTGVTTADIFVAPDGSDSGNGTVERPYATIGKAVSVVRAGQTIALRGGSYRPTDAVVITTSGSAARRITLSNYRDERPIIDASGVPADKWMVTHTASYWTVQGLEIKNSRTHAYVCSRCQFNVLRRLSIHDNVRSALTLRDAGTIGNQVLDSDFFNNFDPRQTGSAGIGLGIGNGSGDGNVLRGNRAFNNADNGFDLGDFGSPVTVEYNWAYGNGVNRWNVEGWQSNADGFHLGGGNPAPAAAHVLRNNAAWDNARNGFSSSGNRGGLEITNNTAFRNGADGFAVADAVATVSSNAAADNAGAPATLRSGSAARGNTWDNGAVGPALFRSTDPGVAQGPRGVDGGLPRVDFLACADGVGATMSGSTPP